MDQTKVTVKVVVGNRVERVSFTTDENLTVGEAIARAGIVLNAAQTVGRNGHPADITDPVSDGDLLVAAGNKDSGTTTHVA